MIKNINLNTALNKNTNNIAFMPKTFPLKEAIHPPSNAPNKAPIETVSPSYATHKAILSLVTA